MIPKVFIHHEIEAIEQINSPTGRLYATPSGKKYPSVTTVLGIESLKFITEWRNRIGHEAADEISRRAAKRGQMVHEACEDYIMGKEHTWGMFDANNKIMFEYLLPTIESVEEVHAMETRLYSDILGTAGTVDLICRIDGEMTILDWKTSGRYKSRDDIHSYFKQCAFYATAFWERTGLAVPNITIAMAIEDYGPVIFKEKVRDWVPKFIETRKAFRALKGY